MDRGGERANNLFTRYGDNLYYVDLGDAVHGSVSLSTEEGAGGVGQGGGHTQEASTRGQGRPTLY